MHKEQFNFIITRLVVKKLSAQHLYLKLKQIIFTFTLHRFIVTAIGPDGAPRNRALFKNIEKFSVRDLVK